MTVAVSVAAGVDNIISAFPALNPHRVLIAVGFVVLLDGDEPARRRGVGQGVRRPDLPVHRRHPGHDRGRAGPRPLSGDAPVAESAALRRSTPSTSASTGLALLFLALRAFSSGCTALTGVEAISNGVPAFKPPKSAQRRPHPRRDGRHRDHDVRRRSPRWPWSPDVRVRREHLRPGRLPGDCDHRPAAHRHRPARRRRVRRRRLGRCSSSSRPPRPSILILAANTAFNGFPLLASILAQDRYLPRQLHTRGDRLAFSNGIMMLAGCRGAR